MGQISIANIAANSLASANDINARFGIVTDEMNGKLDSTNLANGAVTTAKIQDGAVTSAKLSLQSGVDDNGWSYYSLGNYKYFVKSQVVDSTASGRLGSNTYRYEIGPQVMPIGVNQAATFWMGCTHTTGIQFIMKPYWKDTTTLATMAWNVGPDEYVNYTAYWMVIQKV